MDQLTDLPSPHTPRIIADRRPWVAVIANMLSPGLGFLYAGSWRAAIGWALLPIPLVVLVIALIVWFPVAPLNVLLAAGIVAGVLLLGMLLPWRMASRAPRPFPGRSLNRMSAYVCYALVMLFVQSTSAALLQAHLPRAYRNPSASMAPGLIPGDLFFMVHAGPEDAAMNRIVVFQSIDDSTSLVTKRILAVGGDTIAVRHGQLLRNGQVIAEPYILPASDTAALAVKALNRLDGLRQRFSQSDTTLWTLNEWGPVVVPPAEMFVLGDNRGASYDSRYFGPVPVANIRGVARVVYFSRDSSGIRWPRLGRPIR